MLKLLATLRRFFLAGTISLIIILVFYDKNISPGLVYPYSDYVGGWYLLFAFFSPIFAILFWIISSIYIRKKGQSAAFESQKLFISTMGRMLVSDITYPFRIIGRQFTSKKKLSEYFGQIAEDEIAGMLADGSKASNLVKLLFMLFRFAIYAVGILTAFTYMANH